ncbi:MAG: 30S ribosomal protein S6 [Pseudomonadota bacterium]
MNEYETLYILRPELSEADQDDLGNRFSEIIKKHKGGVLFNLPMGRKSFAYPIKKLKQGYYYCLDYAANGSVVKELERSMRLDEKVLRYLTVQRAPDVDFEKRLAEVKAKGEDKLKELSKEGSETKLDSNKNKNDDNTETMEE